MPTIDGLVPAAVSADDDVKDASEGVRVGSDAEPLGIVSALGRGSPEGVITAPPGSDCRNLDGGAGTTLWLKRSGAGTSGWAAIG